MAILQIEIDNEDYSCCGECNQLTTKDIDDEEYNWCKLFKTTLYENYLQDVERDSRCKLATQEPVRIP